MNYDGIILVLTVINTIGLVFCSAILLDLYGDVQEIRRRRK